MAEREGWLLIEAECDDDADKDDDEDDADCAQDADWDFIDDAAVEQGNSRELFNQQEAEELEQLCLVQKRKYESPKEKLTCDLSPRLQAISISPRKPPSSKKRLFDSEARGVDKTDEAANTPGTGTQTQTQVESGVFSDFSLCANESVSSGSSSQASDTLVIDLLKSKNRRATLLAKFKERFGVSFCNLTRPYNSSKTCSCDWVVAGFGIHEQVYEGAKVLLKQHCTYLHMQRIPHESGSVILLLLSFIHQKCRETLVKLLVSVLGAPEGQYLCEPPVIRSPPAALYWFKQALSSISYVDGDAPEWLMRQTQCSAQVEAVAFDLSQMIQWAFDNEYTNECTIAYEYALLADTDANARAWLKSNTQAKYVKDCATMTRYYLRAQMRKMTMGEWIVKQGSAIEDNGEWRVIAKFLRFQHIDFISFINIFKDLLKGVPKRNCLAIYGKPNTGKSSFTMSLIDFLNGRVLSFVNSKSSFWLQPLVDTKIALIDDATGAFWDYADVFLRNAFDGNCICVDAKHKAPTQIKCPPLLITSNLDILQEEKWKYLHSRVACIPFEYEFPLTEEGQPVFQFSKQNWKAFFKKFWTHLELGDLEASDDGDPSDSFRCTAGRTTGPL